MSELLHPEAKYETEIAGGVVIYSLEHLLPRAANPKTRLYRPVRNIKRVYFHHSGRLGVPGWKGAYNSARYVVSQRGFPVAGYHFWFPYEPVTDEISNLVIFRLNGDNRRCWHTGGAANGHGIGVCFQGNLQKTSFSDFQKELFEAFVPWAVETYNLSGSNSLSFHSEAGKFGGKTKPSCPGPYVEELVKEYRNDL